MHNHSGSEPQVQITAVIRPSHYQSAQANGFCRFGHKSGTRDHLRQWVMPLDSAVHGSFSGERTMIRIFTTNDSRGLTITIDGELAGDDVKAVERWCVDAIRGRGSVRLFLREVSRIDEAGRMLLSRLAAKGIELSASGVYTSYIVGEIQGPAGAA